ncbi:MAG TPA: hypothetical protein VG164_09440 [Trebonia sp.]|nr:hypothetical protein [Trebonia sp.]
MRYQLVVRLTAGDLGRRVVLRWRRPPRSPESGHEKEPGHEEVADLIGILEAADDQAFTVRKPSGELVVVPRDRALAGKVIPSARR